MHNLYVGNVTPSGPYLTKCVADFTIPFTNNLSEFPILILNYKFVVGHF